MLTTIIQPHYLKVFDELNLIDIVQGSPLSFSEVISATLVSFNEVACNLPDLYPNDDTLVRPYFMYTLDISNDGKVFVEVPTGKTSRIVYDSACAQCEHGYCRIQV